MQEKKRLALITGASSGIGKSFAYKLSAKGYNLVLLARRKSLLDRIAKDLSNKFDNTVIVYKVDLASTNQRKQVISLLQKKNSSIDLLINNAGFGKFGKSTSVGVDQSLKMIQVNVTALTDFTLSLLPQVLKSKDKSIINVASVAAFHPSMYSGVYAATKSYVYSFSMALSAEYRGRLRILTLCPGLTATDFWKAASVAAPRRFVYSSDTVVEKALKYLGKKNLLIIGYENHARIFIQHLLSDELVLKLTRLLYKRIKK